MVWRTRRKGLEYTCVGSISSSFPTTLSLALLFPSSVSGVSKEASYGDLRSCRSTYTLIFLGPTPLHLDFVARDPAKPHLPPHNRNRLDGCRCHNRADGQGTCIGCAERIDDRSTCEARRRRAIAATWRRAKRWNTIVRGGRDGAVPVDACIVVRFATWRETSAQDCCTSSPRQFPPAASLPPRRDRTFASVPLRPRSPSAPARQAVILPSTVGASAAD